MNPIVCVTEFTEHTFEAVKVAAIFGRFLNERVILVRSVDEREQFPQHLRPRLMRADRPRLAQVADGLRHLGFTLEEEVLAGVPHDGVASFARRASASLVVVGCTPMGSLDAWLLGCSAEHIAMTLTVPMLVVRSAAPFEGWLGGEQRLRVFVAVDLASDSAGILASVHDLRRIGPCDVMVGFVRMADEPAREPESATVCELRRSAVEAIDATEVKVDTTRRGRLVDDDVTDAALEAKADVFVIGTRPRATLPLLPRRSLAGALIRRTPMNVLCVPNAPAECSAAPAAINLTEVNEAREWVAGRVK